MKLTGFLVDAGSSMVAWLLTGRHGNPVVGGSLDLKEKQKNRKSLVNVTLELTFILA